LAIKKALWCRERQSAKSAGNETTVTLAEHLAELLGNFLRGRQGGLL